MSNIILIGFMGSGKTTVGRLLARELGMKFIDLDEVIEEEYCMSINEIFARYGERYFRDLESSVVKSVVPKISNSVIACGGGVILNRDNIEILRKHGIVIYLRISAEEAYNRLKSLNNRPLLNVDDKLTVINELLRLRNELYLSASHAVVDVDGKKPDEIVAEIIQLIRGVR